MPNYDSLDNRPQINGVTLTGNKTSSDLELPTKTSDLVNDGADGLHPFVGQLKTVDDQSLIGTGNVKSRIQEINSKIGDVVITQDDIPSGRYFRQTHNDFTTAYKIKIDTTESTVSSHISNVNNPHSVTKTQIGLSEVENKSSATIRSEITLENIPNLPTSKVTSGTFPDERIASSATWNGKQNDICLSVVDGELCITYTEV